MEYVIVRFEEDRGLIVDGIPQGRTNETLELEKGVHIITIQLPPANFRPESRRVTLADTSEESPREVTFEKI
jgi:hypothetical protein